MASRFQQVLRTIGEDVTHYPFQADGSYGEPQTIQAVVSMARIDEILIEPGYLINDYITVYTDTEIKKQDKIRWNDADYEVLTVQPFTWKGTLAYYKASCRRLIGQ
jgi:hypothetical protein